MLLSKKVIREKKVIRDIFPRRLVRPFMDGGIKWKGGWRVLVASNMSFLQEGSVEGIRRTI